MLDYKLLEALGSVIREQGFDKAAQKLCITQSAVSQRIKALEEQAGQILVTRTVPPKATVEGQRLLKHYLQVENLESDLHRKRADLETEGFANLSIGINADSLATWFLGAVSPFLKSKRVVLDIKVDDQDETHKMLRNGEAAGCISSEEMPVQGCRVTYIGTMTYRLAATRDFVGKYKIGELDETAMAKAPAVIFNRKDDLHQTFYQLYFKKPMPRIPVSYIPSSESFVRAIIEGAAYGMIPDLQARPYLKSGTLVDLAPDCPVAVKLYWHCWNIGSGLLEAFSKAMIKNAVIY